MNEIIFAGKEKRQKYRKKDASNEEQTVTSWWLGGGPGGRAPDSEIHRSGEGSGAPPQVRKVYDSYDDVCGFSGVAEIIEISLVNNYQYFYLYHLLWNTDHAFYVLRHNNCKTRCLC